MRSKKQRYKYGSGNWSGSWSKACYRSKSCSNFWYGSWSLNGSWFNACSGSWFGFLSGSNAYSGSCSGYLSNAWSRSGIRRNHESRTIQSRG